MASLGAMLGSKGKMPMGADEEEGDYDEPMAEEAEAEGEGDVDSQGNAMDPGFSTAYEEYAANPSAETAHAMISACIESHMEEMRRMDRGSKPGGLALIFGGKGKK